MALKLLAALKSQGFKIFFSIAVICITACFMLVHSNNIVFTALIEGI